MWQRSFVNLAEERVFEKYVARAPPHKGLNRAPCFALQLAASRPASVCAASDAAEDAKAGDLNREVYVSMLQE